MNETIRDFDLEKEKASHFIDFFSRNPSFLLKRGMELSELEEMCLLRDDNIGKIVRDVISLSLKTSYSGLEVRHAVDEHRKSSIGNSFEKLSLEIISDALKRIEAKNADSLITPLSLLNIYSMAKNKYEEREKSFKESIESIFEEDQCLIAVGEGTFQQEYRKIFLDNEQLSGSLVFFQMFADKFHVEDEKPQVNSSVLESIISYV